MVRSCLQSKDTEISQLRDQLRIAENKVNDLMAFVEKFKIQQQDEERDAYKQLARQRLMQYDSASETHSLHQFTETLKEPTFDYVLEDAQAAHELRFSNLENMNRVITRLMNKACAEKGV